MNTQASEQSDRGKLHQIKPAADSYFHRHRLYLFGLLSGFGFGLFTVEAFRHEKNPLLYIGGLSLIVLGSILYRCFKDDSQP